jgi:hypothetical protein
MPERSRAALISPSKSDAKPAGLPAPEGLRVPLHADREAVRGSLDAFDHRVKGAAGRDHESVADAIDGLVMKAVHRDLVASENLTKARARYEGDLVGHHVALDLGIMLYHSTNF